MKIISMQRTDTTPRSVVFIIFLLREQSFFVLNSLWLSQFSSLLLSLHVFFFCCFLKFLMDVFNAKPFYNSILLTYCFGKRIHPRFLHIVNRTHNSLGAIVLCYCGGCVYSFCLKLCFFLVYYLRNVLSRSLALRHSPYLDIV